MGSGVPHQIHDRVDFIVTVQDVREELVQVRHVRDGVVLGVSNPLSEVAEDVGFGEDMLLPKILGQDKTLCSVPLPPSTGRCLPVVTTPTKAVP